MAYKLPKIIGVGIDVQYNANDITLTSSSSSTSNPVVIKSSVDVNMASTGTTNIFVTDSANGFIPVRIISRVISATGAGLGPTLSIGTNAATYDNITGTMTFAGAMDVANEVRNESSLFISTTPRVWIPPSTTITCNVTSAISGGLTALICRFYLEGIYLN